MQFGPLTPLRTTLLPSVAEYSSRRFAKDLSAQETSRLSLEWKLPSSLLSYDRLEIDPDTTVRSVHLGAWGSNQGTPKKSLLDRYAACADDVQMLPGKLQLTAFQFAQQY